MQKYTVKCIPARRTPSYRYRGRPRPAVRAHDVDDEHVMLAAKAYISAQSTRSRSLTRPHSNHHPHHRKWCMVAVLTEFYARQENCNL